MLTFPFASRLKDVLFSILAKILTAKFKETSSAPPLPWNLRGNQKIQVSPFLKNIAKPRNIELLNSLSPTARQKIQLSFDLLTCRLTPPAKWIN